MRVWFLLVVLLFLGCEKEIHISVPDQDGKVVVYSFLYPDSAVNIHLSQSVAITSTDPYAYVDQARIKLLVNGTSVIDDDFPANSASGKWDLVRFSYNDSLKIEVSVAGKATISSNTVIPDKVGIAVLDTVTENRRSGSSDEKSYLRFSLRFSDDYRNSDYYQVVVLRESWTTDGKHNESTLDLLQEDPVFLFQEETGGISNWFDFKGLFPDVLINGQEYTVTFLTEKKNYLPVAGEQKVQLTVYLYHHTFHYFEYLKSTIWAKGTDDFPLFEPIPIHTNIDQGIGLFSGMSFDKIQIDILK